MSLANDSPRRAPEGIPPSDLFRSAVGLLVTVASIHTTGGAEMRSNNTNSKNKPVAKDERQSRGDSVNQVTLIGRLVAAPELRETGSGKHVTTVRVATNGKTHAEFHDVVLWGLLADFATSYLGKGRLVYIEGRLQSRQWQATDGSARRTVEIVANRLQALSRSAEAAPAA
jgi:single-strand DNA-binding protein